MRSLSDHVPRSSDVTDWTCSRYFLALMIRRTIKTIKPMATRTMISISIILFVCEVFVLLHQSSDDVGFCVCFRESICGHYCDIVCLGCLTEFDRHGQLIIQVCKA